MTSSLPKLALCALMFLLLGCSIETQHVPTPLNGDAFAGGNGLLSKSDFDKKLALILLQYRVAMEQISTGAHADDLYPSVDCPPKQNRFCKALAGLTEAQKIYIADNVVATAKSEVFETYAVPAYFELKKETLYVEGQGPVDAIAPLDWGGLFTLNYLQLARRFVVESGTLELTIGHELFHPEYFKRLPASVQGLVRAKQIPADYTSVGPFTGSDGMQTVLDRTALLLQAYIEEHVELRDSAQAVTLLSGATPGVSVVGDYLFATGSDNAVYVTKKSPLRWRRMGGESTSEVSAVSQRDGKRISLATRNLSGRVQLMHFDLELGRSGKWISLGEEETLAGPTLIAMSETRLAVTTARKQNGKLQARFIEGGGQSAATLNLDAVLSGEVGSGTWRYDKRFSFGGGYGPYFDNPATGAKSCPPRFTATKITGLQPYDQESFLCLADQSVPDALIFGGMYGVAHNAATYNIYAPGDDGCLPGFSHGKLMGGNTTDWYLHYCYQFPKPDLSRVVNLRWLSTHMGQYQVEDYNWANVQHMVYGTAYFDGVVYYGGNFSHKANLAYSVQNGGTSTIQRLENVPTVQSFNSWAGVDNFSGRVAVSSAAGTNEVLHFVVNDGKIYVRLQYQGVSSGFVELTAPFTASSRVAAQVLPDGNYELYVLDSQGNLRRGLGQRNFSTYVWTTVGKMPL